jgi:hypothetical protein
MKALFAVLTILAGLVYYGPATGQQQGPACGPRDEVLKFLAEKFGETPIGMGLAANGTVVEVLASEGGATWTLIINLPDGRACIAVDGQHWQVLQQAPVRPPECVS